MKATNTHRLIALSKFGLLLDGLREGHPQTAPGASVGDIPYCDLEPASVPGIANALVETAPCN